ncbi:MAG: ABC transporter substrate-binding protein, partial [Dehalococcoidia bacterium]
MVTSRINKGLVALAVAVLALAACTGGTNPTTATVVTGAVSTSSPQTTPEVQFLSGNAPLTIQFSVLDAPGIQSAEWNFDDGNTSTELAPEHTFAKPGTYEVQVKAISQDKSEVVTYVIEVLGAEVLAAAATAPPQPVATATVPPAATARPASQPTATLVPPAPTSPSPTATLVPPTSTRTPPTATAAPAPAAAPASPPATARPVVTATTGAGNTGNLVSAPDPQSAAGMVLIATSQNLGAENGLNSAQSQDFLKNVGIAETLFRRGFDDDNLPWLATEFTIDPNLTGATVKIKPGVPFQIVDNTDFGLMTATDVAFSMNNANAVTNAESIHGQAGDFAALWGEWFAVGDDTILFTFNNFDSTWKDDFLNQSGQAFSVMSKRAYDEKGEQWARDHIVATGVYQVEEWRRDESITMVRRANHHQFEAKTERVKLLEVRESATRSALLRTGEVDMADIDASEAAALDLTGFTQTSTDNARQIGIFFAGNLWEDVYCCGPNQGQTLPTKATFVHDIAWIGSPGRHGADDLEQAKAIRRAMAMSIDREQINASILGGLGSPVHVTYFSTSHPNWDSKYEYPYDPLGAVQLIKSQTNDYQHGSAPSNGVLGDHAFEVTFYIQSGSDVRTEVGNAVAGYWQDIGLTTFVLNYAYQIFRPGIVGRTSTLPWLTSCDKGSAGYPWHFPKGLVQTTATRGGFSCGFESPVILDLYRRMAEARDTATATTAANEYLAYVYDQALQPGVVEVPR